MTRHIWPQLLTGLVIGGAAVLAAVAGPRSASAQAITPLPTPAPLVDIQCRGCHGEKTDQWTLPSGEVLTLGVDLAALDASAHSSRNESSVPCSDCHSNETDYRYPHAANPAESIQGFRAGVEQQCESCHYPHLPFHDAEQTEYVPPTCVDCHGSHDIARVEDMAAAMPTKCIACHEDRSMDWVQDFLTPHPGLGEGAEGYAGSMRCAGCHEDKYFSWRETLHAQIVQAPGANPAAVVGDFESEDPVRTFTLADVSYTVGGKWRQLYLTQTVTGTFPILPAQWNVETREWVPYHPEDWQASDWREECAGCHVTGLNSEAMTFTEFGVGCESCHGPGEAHAVDPENVKPFAEVDAQVCGACHSRGQAPDGHPFPTTYRPGDTLADHFTFATDPEAVWPDGSARLNHQQYMDWQLGSTMSQAEGMSCTTCHAVHDAGAASGQLQEPLDDLCVACHADQKALVKHTPFHEVAMTQNEFFCNDCHMPETATSAVLNDIHNHSLLQPNPQGTIDHGGVAAMPNACNNCHTEPGESAEWAAQTIAYARQQAPPVTGGFFGPGPTPTSPPPPTPLAVVGEPVVTESHVETGQWIRYGLFISFGVIALLAVAWVAYRIRTRGERNV